MVHAVAMTLAEVIEPIPQLIQGTIGLDQRESNLQESAQPTRA